MFFFKACQKCHGDMFIDQDHYGTFIECLQCGSLGDLQLKKEFESVGSPRPVTGLPAMRPQAVGIAA